jgi:EAL domain-containing protein (putative c-di-GMP-specific phosphodiesterase class I)
MVGMCADMGVSTVAEGIETVQQSEALRAMGCSHGQGYLFGRPVSLAASAAVPLVVPAAAARP